MTNDKEVMTASDTVIHPSYGMSLVALQMIRSVAVNERGVQVEMVMNCPGCAAGKVTMVMHIGSYGRYWASIRKK